MNTTLTFLHDLSGLNPALVSNVLAACAFSPAPVIGNVSTGGNVLSIEADRHLTSSEKATLKSVLNATFPIITDA